MGSYEGNLLQIFEKARELNLCPNRLWNSAGESLDKIIPDLDLVAQLNNAYDGFRQYNKDNDHSHCVPNLCEYSKRDFTSVQQRHECTDPSNCLELQVTFRAKILRDAVKNDQPTVWTLDRTSMLKYPLPYMAVSHVWSDGTGAGPSGDGSVNSCLFRHFADIATQYQCQGIWWDTICIPQDKATRSKAIRNIHSSYENARFTLVHDCFLRNWVWRPDTACFAILMSPWFSRGWTALELSRSSKVKIIFKGPNGPLIKDLDEEILASESDPDGPRKEASRIIKRLRHSILTLNDLLSVLKSRSTSWPKDIHVIAALLVDIIAAQGQQDTYRKILRKIGKICPGHLFHNAVPMSNSFTWCPAELMEMPHDHSIPSLDVLSNGDIRGKWYVSPLPADLEARCSLSGLIGLTRLRLRDALRSSTECLLLIEQGKEQAERALVVRAITKSHFQYIAAVTFYQGFIQTNDCEEMEVTILSSPRDVGEAQLEVAINSKSRRTASKEETLHSAIWKGDLETFTELLSPENAEVPDELGRLPIHLAAERGDCGMVEQLLAFHVDTMAVCDEGQSALHKAAWAGSTEVTRILLRSGVAGAYQKDKNKNTALHLAAKMGFAPIVKLLVAPATINIRCANDLTSLHLAAMNGDIEVARLLTNHFLEARDNQFGWTPLHCAADSGNEDVVRLLLDHGANIEASDSSEGWTPLYFASMNGHVPVVRLLLDRHARAAVQDKHHWTPRKFAEINGHTEVLALLPSTDKHDMFQDTLFPPDSYWTPLHCRAINGQPGITKVLTSPDLPVYLKGVSEGWTPLKFSSSVSLDAAFNRLFKGKSSSRTVEGSSLLEWAVQHSSLSATETLLKDGYNIDALNALDDNGKGLIHYAAWLADDLVLQRLIDAGVNIHSTTSRGETALHSAALNTRRRGALELLLEYDLDKGAKDKGEFTALMLAVKLGSEVATRLLLEAGADQDVGISDGYETLLYAVKSGHAAVTRLLVKFGFDVNGCDAHGVTALHLASCYGHREIVDILVEAGAQLDAANEEGRTALILAAENGRADVAECLARSGAKLDATDKEGRTALILAAENGRAEVVECLAKSGAKLDATDKEGSTALMHAAIYGSAGIAECLVRSGANTEHAIAESDAGHSGRTALHFACMHGHEDIVRVLVKAGSDIDRRERWRGFAPIDVAAERGHESIVCMLILAGANPSGLGRDGQSPLFSTIIRGQLETARALIKSGMGVQPDMFGYDERILSVASEGDHEDIVRMLLGAGANPDPEPNPNVSFSPNSLQPLFWATMNGNKGIVEMLVRAGADTERRAPKGWTPLSQAVMNGDEDIVRVLIEAGADLDPHRNLAIYYNGGSPLIDAAVGGHAGIVQALIQGGADIEKTNPKGETALFIAVIRGHEDTVRILLDAGANSGVLGSDHASMVCHAAESGHGAIVKMLIDSGGDPGFHINRHGYSEPPICRAAKGGHKDTVRILLDAGVDPNGLRADMVSPLCYAAESGHGSIVRMLIDAGANPDFGVFNARPGFPPLSRAARMGHEDIVRILLDAGAASDGSRGDNSPPLCYAIEGGNEGIIQMLIDAGANPNLSSFDILPQFSPLCLAARSGYEGTVWTLVKAGAHLESVGSQGRTALLEAVVCGHVKVVRFLIQSGANLEARPPALEMRFPLFAYTSRYAHPEYWAHSTPLILAAREGHTTIVLDLIQAGANIEARDQLQRTALHWAATRNDTTMVTGLIQAGADPTAQDSEQNIPWDLAPHYEVKNLCAVTGTVSTRLGRKVKGLWSKHVRTSSATR